MPTSLYRRIPLALAMGLIGSMLFAGVAIAAKIADADQGGRMFTTEMTGAQEAPGPGDPDGFGVAVFTLNQGQGVVCFELTAENVEDVTAAHIHIAPAGEPGPIVVPLDAPIDGSSSGCVSDVSSDLIKDIRQNPENYYVNVHSVEFPGGAIRGQLSK
jgi:hypothetical protein